MINKGIIKTITNKGVFVEPYSSDPSEKISSCSSGSCESCGKNSKKRLVEVLNPREFFLEKGKLIEFEVSSTEVLKALFRVLIFPLILFSLFFIMARFPFNAEQNIAVISGLSGFTVALLINFLLRKKSRERETPHIIRVL